MTYQIEVHNEVAVPDGISEVLESAVLITLRKQAITSGALTLLLTDDTHMRQLNQDFRDLSKSTDVLSFPADDTQTEEFDSIPYLGDIAISVAIARTQAQSRGHNLASELQLLAIHGVLHLLGYDHLSADDKATMWSLQEEILGSLGLTHVLPTEE